MISELAVKNVVSKVVDTRLFVVVIAETPKFFGCLRRKERSE